MLEWFWQIPRKVVWWIIKKVKKEVERLEELNKYTLVLGSDIQELEKILNLEKWDEIYNSISEVNFEKWPIDRKITLEEKEIAKNEKKEEDKKEVKELKEDEKKDVENKCNNAKETFFDKMNKIYNSSVAQPKQDSYSSRADRLKAGEDYFKV